MISSHKLPHSYWRVVGLQGLELPLKAKINGILPTSAPTKHQPALIWFRGRGGGGCSLPLSDRLPDSHSKHWPSERSQCLSPLGPDEELSSHKY